MVFIKRIVLDKLHDIVIRSNSELKSFVGIDVLKQKDINGTEYELENNSQKYCLFKRLENMSIFVSEEYLLNVLLNDYIGEIQSGDIYSHGYPEGRLIPSNHIEMCQDYFLESVTSDIEEKIINIIHEFY